jgi:hypothetical protein
MSDDMVCIRCRSNFLTSLTSGLAVACTNTAETSLAAFDFCHLFEEVLSTSTNKSALGSPMFQFALKVVDQRFETEKMTDVQTGSVE